MLELLGLFLVLAFIVVLILPWVNLARINGVRKELERLRTELGELRRQREQASLEQSPVADSESSVATPTTTATEATRESCVPGGAAPESELGSTGEPTSRAKQTGGASGEGKPPPLRPKSPAPQQVAVKKAEVTEAEEKEAPQDWFSKVAIWVGSIALLMAGFYMIKYSIDEGLMTPAVRIWLTTGFGALLCLAGFVIGLKSTQAANERIGQALSGAGVACLYFAAYAAVHIYSFLTPGQGFVAMFAVTALAVVLSLKNGAPVAMMGLVGGFLTPWLMSTGSNDTVMLFSYLFLLFCGAQFLCVRRGWWVLLLGSLVGAYLWSAVVIVGNLTGALNNLEGTLIFVLGICLVNGAWAFLARDGSPDARGARLLIPIRLLTWGGGLVQGLALVLIGGFAAVDMALFSLLSVGALLLAVLREDEFIWAAWLALSAVAAATLSNASPASVSWLVTPLGLMALFFAVGHWRGVSSERSIVWRSLSVAAALLVVPLLYLNREVVIVAEVLPGASLWLGLSVLWAALLAAAGEHLFRREADADVAGEYSTFVVFLSLFGLWLYVPVDYFAHVVAGLLLAAALYWRWRGFGRSKLALAALAAVWAIRMLPSTESVIGYFFQEEIHGAVEPGGLALLGWAAGLLGLATVRGCFRRVWDQGMNQVLAWALGLAALFTFVAGYQWLDGRYISWAAETVGGGLTALLAVAAVLLLICAPKWPSLHWASRIATGLVGLRIVWLHLGGSGAAGDSFFWNALLVQFGIPFMAACLLAWRSGEAESQPAGRVYQLAAMFLGFVWATFLVQDYYGGSHLLGGATSSGELYTYSVVWLLLALAYQAVGLWRDQAAIHVGSLVLLLITIGKVFLVDASELEGLFRVLSFLGLGLALIGIGFFYNKVVFARQRAAN